MQVSHKARKIIEAEISNQPSDRAAALYAVRALDRAGLLAPDLPTLKSDYASIEAPVHYSLIGHNDDCVRYDNDSILVGTWYKEVQFSLGKHDEVAAYMSTKQSRNFAHALLAAANHAEQEQPDGNV